ncbi:MAG: transcriptional regulator NrdR [Phycisphaerales bacterium]
MICPYCGQNEDRVIDSRATDGGRAIRRRRVCEKCEKRFTTYERVEAGVRLMVIKRDGSRQAFDAQKMLAGIEAACGKLPITADQKQCIVDEVEEELYRDFDREVATDVIGDRVAARLRRLSQVAYVRFASVYRDFHDVDDFIEAASESKERASRETPGQTGLFEAE